MITMISTTYTSPLLSVCLSLRLHLFLVFLVLLGSWELIPLVAPFPLLEERARQWPVEVEEVTEAGLAVGGVEYLAAPLQVAQRPVLIDCIPRVEGHLILDRLERGKVEAVLPVLLVVANVVLVMGPSRRRSSPLCFFL